MGVREISPFGSAIWYVPPQWHQGMKDAQEMLDYLCDF